MTDIIHNPGDDRRTRFAAITGCISDRSYGPWFAAQIFSASGGLTQSVASAWLMYRFTHSATHLALLGACMTLPVLLGSTFTGALADRLDRRRLLLATQSAFAVVAVGLILAAAAGVLSPALLYLSTALTGCVLALDAPARQVYVLDLVGAERLTAAVSLYEIVMNGSRIVGPAIGGLLLGACGALACFAFNACCFVPAIVVLVVHGRTRSPQVLAQRSAQPRLGGAMVDGLRYAFGSALIRSCLVLAGLSGILFNTTVLLPLLAARSFHLGGAGYGLLMAAFGVGALPGAVLAATTSRRPDGRVVGALAIATGVAMVSTACAPSAAFAYVGMAVTGFASIWFIAVANTLVQIVALPMMRGRVMGAWTMMLPGLGPITGLLVAWLADAAGPRIAFAVAGLCIAVAAVGPVHAGSRRSAEETVVGGSQYETLVLAD